MAKISSVIKQMESLAPLDLQEEWDNSGWQIKLENDELTKVMLALSPTLDVVEQAIEFGCNLIITHHPLFFSEMKTIVSDSIQNKVAIQAIKNDIQIYSAHTNLDKAQGGINDLIAKLLGLTNVRDEFGLVRVGEIDPTEINNFVHKVKIVLNCKEVRLINPMGLDISKEQEIKTVAICSGSGGDFVNKVDADLFITGDIKYHTAIEVQDKAVLDAGHFETERIVLPYLEDYLSEFKVFVAAEKYPWIVL